MKHDVIIIGGGAAGRCWPVDWLQTRNLRAVAGSGAGLPGSRPLPDDIKFGHTRLPKLQTQNTTGPCEAYHRGARGDPRRPGQVIGGGSSINGQACNGASPRF